MILQAEECGNDSRECRQKLVKTVKNEVAGLKLQSDPVGEFISVTAGEFFGRFERSTTGMSFKFDWSMNAFLQAKLSNPTSGSSIPTEKKTGRDAGLICDM